MQHNDFYEFDHTQAKIERELFVLQVVLEGKEQTPNLPICSTRTKLALINRGGFVEHLNRTKVAQQSVTKLIAMTVERDI